MIDNRKTITISDESYRYLDAVRKKHKCSFTNAILHLKDALTQLETINESLQADIDFWTDQSDSLEKKMAEQKRDFDHEVKYLNSEINRYRDGDGF